MATGPFRTAGQAPERPRDVTLAEVKDFLMREPEALANDLTLLARLVPAGYQEEGGVRDFQRFLIDRLSGQLADVSAREEAILQATHENGEAQERVHEAVLTLIDARSFSDFLTRLCEDVPGLIGVEQITLALESAEGDERSDAPSPIRLLPEGSLDHLMGPDDRVAFFPEGSAFAPYVGESKSRIRSWAMIRLNFSKASPSGLLALGSEEADTFTPEAGTVLLTFLGRTVERCIAAWLDLPPSA